MTSILSLKGVNKSFGDFHVIGNVDLDVWTGEKHALIGPNGAGKSTLFNLITGHYVLSSGTIHFKGARINGLAPYKITRLGLARSFQIINIFRDLTVFENMRNAVVAKQRLASTCIGRLKKMTQVTKESDHLLDRFGLTHYRNEPAGTLGYGQQRALEVGLAIALEPELVLLDEPGAGLSPEETRAIVKLIREVTEQKTLLIVEHDMDVVFNLADRISVLTHGTILTTGTPDQIRNDEAVREAYLGNIANGSSSVGLG
jgi:branched-chain amino acid transport system ATP-binding protein